ncbi:MAG: argininosuccinate lyase [Planctomycetes bacterium]|nr:argininosuccinate lyase [Planctomycetota bacterium]
MSKNLRERLGPIDAFNAAFVASVRDDERLVREDILGSMAHARMLERRKLISRRERNAILKGLERLRRRVERGTFRLDPTYEDVHMNVEHALGPAGAKLHTARSRNDQVALDLRLWTIAGIDRIDAALVALRRALLALARRHVETILPGVTHLQRAQPVVLAHLLLAWADAIDRDRGRFADARRRAAVSPLGAGALAGTTLPIDPNLTARDLGLRVFTNSIDAVSDRDFAVETAAAAALFMAHLSQMAEMLILWSAPEFGFVELPDALCTSSSLMPQKKNPDMIELVRGKAGRVFGSLVNLLATLKGLPCGYNRDLQETKPALFDVVDAAEACAQAMSRAFRELNVNADRMREAASDASLLATDLAEYLVGRGAAFRDAHAAVGRLMRHCSESGRAVTDMTPEELRAFHPKFGSEVRSILSAEASVARRASPGGTGISQVRRRLKGGNHE